MALSLAVAALIAGVLAAGASATAAGLNYKAQKDTNAQNLAAAKAVNEQAQYNTEHAHQIEMNDLQAAGLNPVLTAMGGNGAPQASLNVPRAQAPQLDLSGISNALNNMTHTLMLSELINAKVDAANSSADAKIASAQIGATSRETVADKYINAGRLKNFYKNESAGSSLISSAKQANSLSSDAFMESLAKKMGLSVSDFKKMLKTSWIRR